jgi:putative membrane protein
MKLSKISIPYRAGQALLTLAVFGLFAGIDIARFNLTAAAVILCVVFTVFTGTSLWFYVVWKKFEFEVTEDTFDIRSGVLHRRKREIPLKRIQNVDVRRNIIHRILGIAKVNIETAGGKNTEASLKYVDFDIAKYIQSRVRRLKQGIEEHEENESTKPIFEITGKELGILSLTSINEKAVVAGFGLLSISGAFFGQIKSVLGTTGFIIAILSFIGVFVVSLAGSTAANFSRFYDFKLYRRGDSLEYERGLINRSEGSIPLEKIQVVSIEENPLKRFVGYATLKVETAGYGPGNQENTGAEVAVPLAEKERVMKLSKKVVKHKGFDIQGVSTKAPRRYFGRYMIASSVLAAVIIGAANILDLSFNPLYLTALIPVSGVASYLKYVHKGFYEGEEFFFTRNGFWTRKTSIVPYYRIQTLIHQETIFQRRLGLSTLVLDTAGISVFGSNPKVTDLDAEVAGKLFERIFKSFKRSRT